MEFLLYDDEERRNRWVETMAGEPGLLNKLDARIVEVAGLLSRFGNGFDPVARGLYEAVLREMGRNGRRAREAFARAGEGATPEMVVRAHKALLAEEEPPREVAAFPTGR